MRHPFAAALGLCLLASSARAADTVVLAEDFASISEWKDLSRLLPWGGQAAGTSAFRLQANDGRQAINVTADAVANSSYTSVDGLRAFTCLDYPFPAAIDHATTIVTITFDARWDALSSSGEAGRFMPVLLGSYTASQVTAANVSRFADPADPYGRPAYHLRLRPSTVAKSIFVYGGGTTAQLERYADAGSGAAWWLPGFISAAGFDSATPPNPVVASPGIGPEYPSSSWAFTSTAVGGTAWRTYAYAVLPDRQELRVDGALKGSMPLPASSGAPAYQTFPTLRALRLFWRASAAADQQAWIANLRITTNKAPTAGGDSYLVNMASGSTTVVSPTLLANDGDVDGDALTIEVVRQPTYGSVAINPDGTFTYTHTLGHLGGDAFQYRVSDGRQTSAVATVALNADQPAVVPAHAGAIALAPVVEAGGSPAATGQITQMAWGPDGRLYTASNSGGVDSWAYDPATGVVAGKRDAASINGCGIAFHRDAMYVQSPGPYNGPLGILDNGRITRLRDQDGDGIWGEAGETNVVIVDKLPNGEHTCEQLIVRGNTLFVAFGTSTGFGRDTAETTKDDGGETSYGGTICWIQDLDQVPDTVNAAGLGSSGKQFQTVGTPFTTTAAGKLVVHSSGTRNPFALGLDGDGELWFSNNQERVRPDAEFGDDVHDQFFRAFPKADYGYANDNWRTNPTATGAGYFLAANRARSHTFDNTPAFAAHPAYGSLHDPDAPVGLGPHSSADGFAFVTSNRFPLAYHKRAFITRWNSADNREDAPGGDNLRYGDLVSIDHATGATDLIADGFRNPLAAIEDPLGNLLVADWGAGRLYRLTPVQPVAAAHPFQWAEAVDGAWSDAARWSTGRVPHQWGSARYAVTIATAGTPTIALDRPATIASLDLGDRLALPAGQVLTVSGGYAQRADGTLLLRLAGAAGSAGSRVAVGSAATLAGTLRVELVDGFAPVAGDRFTLMTWASRSGAFATLDLPPLASGLAWSLGASAADLVLECVPVQVNQPPTVATAASASANPVTGATTTLAVLGADDGGAANLRYTWSTVGTPPAPVAFNRNGTNAARSVTATFKGPGAYAFRVTIADAGNLTATSAVDVTVVAALASTAVAPAGRSIQVGASQAYAAVALDQFGTPLAAQPASFAWTASGGGAITAAGMFTAGSGAGGPFTVAAATGGRSGTARLTVVPLALPAPWLDLDIGSPGATGSVRDSGTVWTMQAAGSDIWAKSDSFHFAYQPLVGDGVVIARVVSLTNTNGWAKAGVMIRDSLAATSRNAFVLVSAGNGVSFQRRSTDGGSTTSTASSGKAAPYWLKLTRSGTTFTAATSPDGAAWTPLGAPATIAMGATVQVGLAQTSHVGSTLGTATFDHVGILPTGGG